ncbi:CotH kinase family protein [Metabacillus fastidiosus]|uniref:CotH kinase family protein n=1 Tax=Metabacillus fastidiosus TaxID=1458 RepID=UPI002DB82895|nr:CotH kinase family protein [Metabacillus fastidiosus]MEC2075698.1 CotH kinase family protein [Metabacillus fastidiosus]
MIYKQFRWVILICCLFITAGCNEDRENADKKVSVQEEQTEEESYGIEDDPRLYEFEDKSSVATFYVTISPNNETTFYELDNWYSIHNNEEESPKLDIKIEEGTEKGIQKGSFGFDEPDVNASIQLRGKSTRVASQKSFKIKLYDKAGLWRGQKTLNLNKHPYDGTRVRNKLSFDYFTLIPNLSSMRTQFVHLYVKDLTNKQSNGEFVDYGLYTHIEQANERYLATHGLDSNGNLYKATHFEFYRYPDQLKLEDDQSFKKKDFESILEIKGSKDHRALLNMLDEVNDYSLNINDVVNRHFDRENYLTWIATNILMGNHDITTQNFYLYKPLNSNKWYFNPWDYDGTWRSSSKKEVKSEIPEWQNGLSNYWGSVLHKRFFKDPKNVEALSKKIEELSKIINPEQTKKLLDEYYPTVSQFVKRAPDKEYLPINNSDYKEVYYGIVNASKINKAIYYRSLEKPMPFFLGDPFVENKQSVFMWDSSYDIQGDDITYLFQISKDPSFSTIVYEKKSMVETEIRLNKLVPGTYYWRAVAKDKKGNEQKAFDQYEDGDTTYFGIRKIVVK